MEEKTEDKIKEKIEDEFIELCGDSSKNAINLAKKVYKKLHSQSVGIEEETLKAIILEISEDILEFCMKLSQDTLVHFSKAFQAYMKTQEGKEMHGYAVDYVCEEEEDNENTFRH